ncbi:hypothetical protein C8R44DRAFT_958028 [Mycena epipterygia]|nr:hypothetical protein C8R44DRAFT_958028 [Mycena epipterygia]
MYVGQSESDEYAKNWESYQFVKRLTLLSGEKPDSPIQNRKHSVGGMEAKRGRLALDHEVNLVHKAIPGTSGDEDEAREIPSVIERAPTKRSSTKGWWVGSENCVRDEADRGEVDVASTRKDPPFSHRTGKLVGCSLEAEYSALGNQVHPMHVLHTCGDSEQRVDKVSWVDKEQTKRRQRAGKDSHHPKNVCLPFVSPLSALCLHKELCLLFITCCTNCKVHALDTLGFQWLLMMCLLAVISYLRESLLNSGLYLGSSFNAWTFISDVNHPLSGSFTYGAHSITIQSICRLKFVWNVTISFFIGCYASQSHSPCHQLAFFLRGSLTTPSPPLHPKVSLLDCHTQPGCVWIPFFGGYFTPPVLARQLGFHLNPGPLSCVGGAPHGYLEA